MPAVRVHPRLSATCLGLALTLGTLWWSAASTWVVLHDDARLVGALTRVLDQPAVRAQLGEWTGTAFDQALRLADAGAGGQTKTARRAVAQVQATITSTAPLEPLVTVVTGVVVGGRDAAVAQLDARAVPKTAVAVDVAPLLRLAGVEIDKKTARAMGLAAGPGKRVTLPLLTGEQLDLLQRRYDLMVLIRQWAGWAALALLVVSVATSRRPLRTLAVAAGLVALIALVLPHLLAYGQARVVGTDLGSLVAPLLAAAAGRVATVAVPVAVVAGLLAVGLGALQVVVLRRQAPDRGPIESES
jgi:hypothetical protein